MPRVPTLIDNPDGSIRGVNLKRISEMPYFLLTNTPQNTIIVPASQASPPRIMSISGEGPAQILGFSAERTAAARVFLQLQDGQNIRALMNGACHIDTIFGRYNSAVQTITGAVFAANTVTITTAAAHGYIVGQLVTVAGVNPLGYNGTFVITSVPSTTTFTYDLGTNPGAFVAGGTSIVSTRPYPLPEAIYIDEQRSIVATFTDISAAVNNIAVVMENQRMLSRVIDNNLSRARARMEKRQYLSLPYFYTFDNGFSTMGVGVTNTETITIGQDHHFDLFQISGVSTGPFDINIVNTATGESIVDAPLGTNFAVSSDLLVGSAAFPFRFHEPRFFEIHSKLIITLTNRHSASNTVHLTLGGRILADRMWS